MKKTIVCLKWGDKYSPHYVNVLYNMCKRHCTISYDFICLTENPKGLIPEIITKPLPNIPLQGWWMKPFVFSKDLGLKGDVLFLDLDIVVYKNIDKLWEYNISDFMIIRDFTRTTNPNWNKYNSSVFKFNAKTYHWIWDEFSANHKNITTKNFGDQDYLFNILKDKAKTWPDNWVASYKWEMRSRDDIRVIHGKRNFATIANPNIPSDGCIAVFHGEPNPHDVKDPWVIENWK